MRSASDPRHKRRIELMQSLFSLSFSDKTNTSKVSDIIPNIPAIDAILTTAAPEWPLEKIAKIDLAVLRLAVYELTIEKAAPPKVVIDEAIELAKSFGNEHSAQFINGVLGYVYAHHVVSGS